MKSLIKRLDIGIGKKRVGQRTKYTEKPKEGIERNGSKLYKNFVYMTITIL